MSCDEDSDMKPDMRGKSSVDPDQMRSDEEKLKRALFCYLVHRECHPDLLTLSSQLSFPGKETQPLVALEIEIVIEDQACDRPESQIRGYGRVFSCEVDRQKANYQEIFGRIYQSDHGR